MIKISFLFVLSVLIVSHSFGQLPVKPLAAQKTLLQSKVAQLRQNKKIVYDFWREVIEAGHLDLADKYMAETYMQHNPNVVTGRQGFIDFFSKFKKPVQIVDTIKAPVVDIVAEGDKVILSFVSENKVPGDSTKRYTTTWFDMLRIENGKIAEHWDSALMMAPPKK
jgi:predicted SnoaL-like aldol condensation-catalyzing enzyme